MVITAVEGFRGIVGAAVLHLLRITHLSFLRGKHVGLRRLAEHVLLRPLQRHTLGVLSPLLEVLLAAFCVD